MFMTDRNDPKAIFQPVYACNPDTDALQIVLQFVTRETSPAGGGVCVRGASGNRYGKLLKEYPAFFPEDFLYQ